MQLFPIFSLRNHTFLLALIFPPLYVSGVEGYLPLGAMFDDTLCPVRHPRPLYSAFNLASAFHFKLIFFFFLDAFFVCMCVFRCRLRFVLISRFHSLFQFLLFSFLKMVLGAAFLIAYHVKLLFTSMSVFLFCSLSYFLFTTSLTKIECRLKTLVK